MRPILAQIDNCLVGNVKLVGVTTQQLLDWRFRTLGSCRSLSRCAELCCSNEQCKGALLFNNSCYEVKCENPECEKLIGTWPLPISPNTNAGRYMEISRIQRRQIESQLVEAFINDSNVNQAGKRDSIPSYQTEDNLVNACQTNYEVHRDKMLKYGRRAGTFESLGSMSFEKCAERCCTDGCDALLHLHHVCYKVTCNDARYQCEMGSDFEQKSRADNDSHSKLVIFRKRDRRNQISKRETIEEYITVKLNATNLRYDVSLDNENSVEFFQLASYAEDL